MALNTSRPIQPWLLGAVLGPRLPVWGRGWTDCAWGGELSDSVTEYCDFNSGPEAKQVTLVQSSAVDVSVWVTSQPECQCFFIDPAVEGYFSC